MKRVVAIGSAALVVVGGALTVAAAPAWAANLSVTSTADVATNFGACGNGAQTTSSGSLREAICAANNVGAASSTITVAAGTYTLTNGELQMGKVFGSNITLSGAGQTSTIISGNNATRVFDLDPNIVGGVSTTISGVTISGGKDSTFGGAGIIAGSGHAATEDSLIVSNSIITGNVVNSTATNKPGGGISVNGGSLTITNSTISNNSAGGSPGGGVSYTAEGDAAGEQLSISGTTFTGNQVNAGVANVNLGGGGLETSMSSAASPTFTVTNSRFINNVVTASGSSIAHGGAIFSQTGPLNVTESTFTGNSATGGAAAYGGAISVTGNAPVLHYNRFTGNNAPNGSAVAIPYANGATVNATDNWWGCNTGPGTAACDTVFGGPTVSPRLVFTADASPSSLIGPNGTSTITAALTQDSQGSAISAGNLDAFTDVPVGWSDPLPSGATVGAASSNISSGSASISYDSQAAGGAGHVLATLDNETATAALTVVRPPAITSGNTASLTVGTAGSFTVTTSGYPTAAIGETGTVPPGMSFVDNGDGTATLSGAPSAGGSYPLSLTANNGVAPNATQTLTVSVNAAPIITSADATTFAVGDADTFTVTTSGLPTPHLSTSAALPSWLTLTDNGDGSATLAGTAPAGSGGTYAFTIDADNNQVPAASQAFTLTVDEAPSITSAGHAAFALGAPGTFTVTTAGFPTPALTAAGSVPPWLSLTDNGDGTATLAGSPPASGSFPITIQASNTIAPDATQAFVLTVRPTVTSVSPSSGPTTGGTTITIVGTGFTGHSTVLIGQGNGPGSGAVQAVVQHHTSGQLTVTTPTGARGKWNVFVHTPGLGTSAPVAADRFTYQLPRPTVTSVSPPSGPAAGGTTITIDGTGFTPDSTVLIGQGAGSSSAVTALVQTHTATELTAITTAGTAGIWYVFVRTPGAGVSVPASSGRFTYLN